MADHPGYTSRSACQWELEPIRGVGNRLLEDLGVGSWDIGIVSVRHCQVILVVQVRKDVCRRLHEEEDNHTAVLDLGDWGSL